MCSIVTQVTIITTFLLLNLGYDPFLFTHHGHALSYQFLNMSPLLSQSLSDIFLQLTSVLHVLFTSSLPVYAYSDIAVTARAACNNGPSSLRSPPQD